MTNREKLRELFPYLNIVGTVFTDKRTEQVLVASVNFNWLDAEYREPTTKNDKEQEDITWIVGNNNVQIAVRNMPVDMMQKICAIIGNKQEVSTKNSLGVDCISRADAIQAMQDKVKKLTNEDTINGLCGAVAILFDLPSVTPQEPIHGKCNQCKHYEGVHNVQGHAPCSYHKIGGVMWDWYCSQFESEG